MDIEILLELERRFPRGPHELLQVSEHASVAETCEAFARLARSCDPGRFSAHPMLAARARRALRRLRIAFHAVVRRARPPDARPAARHHVG